MCLRWDTNSGGAPSPLGGGGGGVTWETLVGGSGVHPWMMQRRGTSGKGQKNSKKLTKNIKISIYLKIIAPPEWHKIWDDYFASAGRFQETHPPTPSPREGDGLPTVKKPWWAPPFEMRGSLLNHCPPPDFHPTLALAQPNVSSPQHTPPPNSNGCWNPDGVRLVWLRVDKQGALVNGGW